MGTSAIVARPTGTHNGLKTSWEGVIVHYDGYPENMVPTLEAIIARDGVAKLFETLFANDRGGWSYLWADRDKALESSRSGWVIGYGRQYDDGRPGSGLVDSNDDGGFTRYIYIIGSDGAINRFR